MKNKVRIGLVFALLFTLMATAVQAQTRGSIRGSVREDTNGDGKCDAGAAIHGMTIQFKSTHFEQTTVYLQSGSDGTYGLVAAGLGTWEVTAMPNSDFRITSAKTKTVFIDENERLALGVNFCAQKTTGSSQTTASSSGNTVLPQSGAPAAADTPSAALAVALTLGALLFVAGFALEARRRHL